jgi:hypothetical protein
MHTLSVTFCLLNFGFINRFPDLFTNHVKVFHITVSVVLHVNFGDFDGDVNQSKSDERYEKCHMSANRTTGQSTLNEETASWYNATLTTELCSVYNCNIENLRPFYEN